MLTVRAARDAELGFVGDLTLRAYLDHVGPGSYREKLRDAADRAKRAELLVAADDDEVLGTITIARYGEDYNNLGGPGEMEFRMLAVEPGALRRGVGKTLVQAVIDRARVEGYERVVLSTQDSMTAAHRLYDSLGFRRTPQRDWEPEPGLRLLTFALDLT